MSTRGKVSCEHLKRMERRGYLRLYWFDEDSIPAMRRISFGLLGVIKEFWKIANTPLPVRRTMGGRFVLSAEDQMGAIRKYEESRRRLRDAFLE